MRGPRPGEEQLIDLMSREGRGPRRHALFATWLTSRICLDMGTHPGVTERNARRRLAALRKRLGTLSLPVAFRRALHEIIEDLTTGTPGAPASALDALSRVVRDTLGDRPATAIGLGVKHLRRRGTEGVPDGPVHTERE